MTESDAKYLALWNDYYRLWDYKNAAQAFLKIEEYKWLYNAGNAFFRFWEESSSIGDKMSFWERSLDFYQQSLDQKQTSEAQTNYDIVRQKLDEIIEEQNQENEQEQNSQQDTPEWADESEQTDSKNTSEAQQESWNQNENQDESSDASQQTIPQPRGEQYKLWEWPELPEMTPWEKASLERYIERLEEEQRQNQKYFNKSPESSSSRDAFDSFFRQFGGFDSWNTSWEKDW